MALWLIITIGGALIGAALTMQAAAQCKQASGSMLQHYRELLAEARHEKEKREEKEKDGDGTIEPPDGTEG